MADTNKTTISFGFSKKLEAKKLSKSAVGESTNDNKTETDFVLSLEGNEVKSSAAKQKDDEPFVIPLIKKNRWREGAEKRLADVKKEHAQNDLDRQAAREVIEEAARYNETWDDRDKPDPTLEIPLLMQNKIPEGFETDDRLDVALRPDGPDDADYEQIPIEQFGFAMLRGMGWKEGQGIGKNGKIIAPVEAHLRPKGLGLGADRKQLSGEKAKDCDKKDAEEDGDLELKKGSYCVVLNGKHKDLYGLVEGIDEDNARVVLKLTLSGQSVTMTQYNVKVVNRKEYEKYSKYLNKGKADRYKEDETKQNGHGETDRGSSDRNDDRSRSHKDDKYRTKQEDSSRKRKHESEAKSHSKHHKSDSKSSSTPSHTDNMQVWLQPHLRVRIVDKHYKKGKYYKEKVVVVDVVSVDSAVCRTDDGKVLEDLSHSQLETVIPKSDSAHVMLCAGKHRGQLGKIMKKDKNSCKALIQLLSDRDLVLKVDFDEICDYVGDIDNDFNY